MDKPYSGRGSQTWHPNLWTQTVQKVKKWPICCSNIFWLSLAIFFLRLIFEQNSVTPKITLDDFDIPQAELSQTKEISVADSSLVEMLNLYEDAKNQRSLDLEDFVPAEPEESLRLNVTLPKNKPRKKSPPKKVVNWVQFFQYFLSVCKYFYIFSFFL